ncbi:cardioactive peptide isoform X2 [Cryptotermes secundus]|uniref:cardioactive peptide isoform X2 n=1 Tax=Cryptotermes secundus TaxID=105785 RepID=UPI000CD7AE88|nr:cardioactive peptide isoform X2 [Cryptotermes secundus]
MKVYHVIIACSVTVLLVVLELPLVSCDSVIVQRPQIDPAEMDRLLDPKRKRPFCNAFTGCGKKRSDESMGTLVDMNSEPAVEDLSRQILSEAKLWEAIQEARVELLRRRQEQMQQSQFPAAVERPVPYPIAGYRRKRSAEPDQEEFTKSWSR